MPKTFRTRRETPLLREPANTAEKLGSVPRDTTFVGDLEDNFIKTTISAISSEAGFVRFIPDSEKDIVPGPLVAGNASQFCDLVTQAAREVGADRDYLMAVAYDGTKNLDPLAMGDATTPAVGPFQFSKSEWKAIIQEAGVGDEFTEDDRLNWMQQPKVAALRVKRAAEKFKKEFKRLPVFKELYFLQLIGDAALAALKTPAKHCREAMDANAVGTYAAELRAGSLTVSEALAALQKRLETAYAEALKIIDQQPLENRFIRASAGDPTWMAVAREELARGVSETPDKKNPPEIMAYFQSFNAAVGTIPGQEVPWCGAFVGFCIARGAPAIAATVTIGAVGANFWLTWGVDAPIPPPVGSIVVFPGQHVGFLAEMPKPGATTLQVLGGNQSDRVSITAFASAGAKFRWNNTVPQVAGIKQLPGNDLFKTLAVQIMDRLAADFPNLAKVHLAAILGNLGHECGGFKLMQELHPIDGGPGGLGWAQWTASRRTLFENWLKTNGNLPVDSFEGNYSFLKRELETTHKGAIKALVETSDIHSAVVAFESIFEVANEKYKAYDKREQYAQIALSLV